MFLNTQKIVAVILSVAMLLSVSGISAMAEEITEISDEIVETVAEAVGDVTEAAETVVETVSGVLSDKADVSDDEDIPAETSDIELASTAIETVSPVVGSGTEEAPYMIYTEEELIAFAVGNIEDGLTAYWSLQSDIELTADTWAPIGAYTAFTGVFDGNGHTISSSKLFQSTAMSGIFGQNAGLIKNLNVDVTIEEVATNTGTLCAVNNGTIENCHVTGSITTSENKNIGGLVGWNENGSIINCSSSVIINAPNSTVGGLVGYNRNATIKYSYTYNKTIENEEEELVSGNTVGGLVGYVNNNNTSTTTLISNCYTLGKIKGGSRVGGLIGYCDVSYGDRGYITVEYCYAKGVITSGDTKGGLIGGINTADRIAVRYCYFNNINNYNQYGFAVSLLDITKQETFYDWNFDEVWAIDAEVNNGYPYMDYKGSETITIDGEGTEESPYIITTEKQLCYLASEKLPLSAYYKLANDIEITANFWTPISTDASESFSGVFDGNGYSITGVHVENIYYNFIGLFGKNSGTIKNLTVESWFKGNKYTGGLVGYNTGIIDNCNTYISDSEYYISGSQHVGGLIGQSNGLVTNSYSASDVNASGTEAGGLIGRLSDGKVRYCYATGDITAKNAGGLIGYVHNDISNRTTTIVSNCYAMGKITGTNNSGGLIGYCDVAYGDRGYITVEYCYARGLVVVQGSTGGLIGNINTKDRNVIRYCYYNIANTGNNIGFGVKAATLKEQATLYGWDFDNIWKIEKGVNSGYPHIDIRGETPVNVLQGNGEEDRPYLIYTEEDLRSLVFDTYGLYDLSVKHFYKLMNDIEVTANFWTPIGSNATNVFNGIFDGNGHTISGIKLSNSHYSYSGLFGESTGTVKNLNVIAEIDGREYTGAIVGRSFGTVENCTASGTISSSIDPAYVGGIVGLNSAGTISGCYSDATVSAPNYQAGGIAGQHKNGIMEYCWTKGNVSGKIAGGLVGRIYNENSSITSIIRHCFTIGEVYASQYAGGLVGDCDVAYGDRGYIKIEYSYSTSVPEGGAAGGLVGNHNTISRNFIRYSYYNSANTGNKIGFSATLNEMTDKNLYYMWDFDNIWDIDTNVNGGYPYLNVRGKTKTHYIEEGYGDEDDPYMIYTEEDLWTLVLGTYDLTAKFYYQLQNDIEITAEHWTPIGGNHSKTFNGIFDGNGYTISGLKLLNSELPEQGLFGSNSGTIKNLNVEAVFEGNSFTGALCASNSGIIDNCSSSGNVSTFNTNNEVYTGGLVGINYGTISNSHSTATADGKNWDCGGLVGRNQNGLISESYATGNATGRHAGGLVGRLLNENSSTTATIRNCYATGEVTATENGGGLVGYSHILYNDRGYSSIENSYSLGAVSAVTAGGLVGYSNNSVRNSILSSYYNQTNTGLNDIDRGTPLEDSAMKLQASYVGWNFDDIWCRSESINNGYPYLNGMIPTEIIDVTGITLDNTELDLTVGENAKLTATVIPSDATNQSLVWTISDDSVIMQYEIYIDGSKEYSIYASRPGTSTVTVSTPDGKYSASCIVNVSYATGINPMGVCGDNITWRYANGVLTITGTGAIYDYSSDNDYTTNPPPWFDFRDEITDIVLSEGITRIGDFALVGCVNMTGISLPSTLESIGERAFMDWINLIEVELPESVTTIEDGAFEWNDNFTKITIYDNAVNFGTGVFEACGKLTIHGIKDSAAHTYANDNNIPFVSIGDEEADTTISVTGIIINKSQISLEEGDVETLTATVIPENATNKNVTWKSSDTNVATVSNGVVTAIKAGTTVITATTADGGYTATCTVTIIEKAVDENAPKVSISDIKTMPGKEIQVTVDLEGNTGFASLGIEVGYNSDIMTLTNVISNSGVGATFTKAQYLTVNPYNMSWDSAENVTYNGNLATLTFTVNEDAPDGVYPITLDYYKGVNGNYVDGDNVNYDENFEAVGFVYISGNVIVARYIPGDINGDESVDNKDATYLLRYLAGWEVAGLVEEALDIDGNGSTDNKDATILLRYLAGWEVTLH